MEYRHEQTMAHIRLTATEGARQVGSISDTGELLSSATLRFCFLLVRLDVCRTVATRGL